MSINLVSIICAVIVMTSAGDIWQNQFDQVVKFSCEPGMHLSRVQSEFNSEADDRRWAYECRIGYVSRRAEDCEWSGFVNSFDGRLSFKCPDGGVIAGVQSYHNNHHEDRRFSFRCCKLNTKNGTNCANTGFLNEMDGYLDYEVERGSAIVGFKSYHSNEDEDRRWIAVHCNFVICRAKTVKILQDVKLEEKAAKVVGIATSQGCAKGISYTTSLQHAGGSEVSYSIKYNESSGFSIGASIALGFMGLSFQTSLSHDWSTSTTQGKRSTKSTASGSSQSLTYLGPGASLILADVKEYATRVENVDAEYEVICEDGDRFVKISKVTLDSNSYSHAHYTQRHVTFEEGECTVETEACLDAIRGSEFAEEHPNTVLSSFEKCIRQKTAQTQIV